MEFWSCSTYGSYIPYISQSAVYCISWFEQTPLFFPIPRSFVRMSIEIMEVMVYAAYTRVTKEHERMLAFGS